MKSAIIFTLLLISTNVFAAEWQCGPVSEAFGNKVVQLPGQPKAAIMVAANEAVDDVINASKDGDRFCVKGTIVVNTRRMITIYDIKAD